jgi:hypothetical protein
VDGSPQASWEVDHPVVLLAIEYVNNVEMHSLALLHDWTHFPRNSEYCVEGKAKIWWWTFDEFSGHKRGEVDVPWPAASRAWLDFIKGIY